MKRRLVILGSPTVPSYTTCGVDGSGNGRIPTAILHTQRDCDASLTLVLSVLDVKLMR
jgi:hypothetical protein